MKRLALILLLLFSLLTSAYADQAATDGYWIDVRTVAEYQQGHKEGAVNIPHTAIAQRISEVTKDKDAEIHVYCAAGVRAEIARKTLERMGYTHVTNEGGLSDVQ